jgi:crossover junction endodeoxyribonuclease RusA
MQQLLVSLPWPDSALSPNARGVWQKRYRAAKRARQAAYYATLAAMRESRQQDWEPPVHLLVTAFVRGHKRPDEDNLRAALKSTYDGIADALGVNDREFSHGPVAWVTGQPERAIEIVVREI